MLEELLLDLYGLEVKESKKSGIGAGSDTYFITCEDGKYVMKFPAISQMNNPKMEPDLCTFLLQKEIPVSEFICNRFGAFFIERCKRAYFSFAEVCGRNGIFLK